MKKRLSALLSLVLAIAIMIPSFSAYAANFKDSVITLSKTEYIYTGSEKKPKVSIYKTKIVNGEEEQVKLVENTDYKLYYANNVKSGIGTVKIIGIGKYQNAKPRTKHFDIKPPKVTGFKVKKTTNSSVSLKWDAVSSYSGVTGYCVYTCDVNGGNKQKVATTTSTTATISNLHLASKYNFVVYAYKKTSKKTLYGNISRIINTTTKPNQVIINSVTNTNGKTGIKVSWGHKNGTGYQIKYSTSSNFKDAKSVYITKNDQLSTTVKVPSNEKTYYFKVRAYKESITGKKNYGAWSSALTNKYSKVYSSYSSNYVDNKDRTTNLQLACSFIDGKILQPGETFSFNQTVGKRTKARGFKAAHVFAGANETVMGVGGGVCQVASTIFNAALLGNFQIVERHQHSQRVTYVPLGRDAAIYWGSQDFKFKNNTNRPVKIVMKCSGGTISCSLKVSEDVKPKKVSLNVYQNGNHFTLKRTVDGKVNYSTSSNY